MECIYIIRVCNKTNCLLKLGYTKDIEQRILSYQSQNPFTEFIKIYKIDNSKDLEKLYHNTNKSDIGNEWYLESNYSSMISFINDNGGIEINIDDVIENIKRTKKRMTNWIFMKGVVE